MESTTRILVIDDEDDVRALLEDALQEAGYEVILAENGARGLEEQRRRPAEIVITDLFMPEKEGMETIHDLKKEFPGVKIIAMSGGGRALQQNQYLSLASRFGAELVLSKPFDSRLLVESVRLLLGAKAR